MQGGYLSLLYSISDKPLKYWSKQKSRTGSIQRVFDKELNEGVLEIQDVEDANCQKTMIMCPPDTDQILNVTLSVLVIILKSLQSRLLIQIQVVDKDNVRHLINLSNVEAKKKTTDPKITPLRMHLLLEPGWNKLEIDLGHLCKIFGAQFKAVSRLKICASCQIRRIYFLDRHYNDDEISLAMYQGFFDFYMQKWGINTVERITQTKRTAAKPTKENAIVPITSFNKLFLKNLQAKSDKIIDEYLSKHPKIAVKDYLDFKRKAKIKPYAIPDKNKLKSKKSSETSLVDLNELRRYFTRENSLYDKLDFEEKNVKKSAGTAKTTNKQEATNSMYKVYRYTYPIMSAKKPSETKKEAPKYKVVNK